MTKLANLLKERNDLKTLTIDLYQKIGSLTETNERLRQLNARLSKDIKNTKEYTLKVEEQNKKFKADLLKAIKQ